ncbi:MAG: TIGR00297 family protein [Roseofilum sp. SBFL]|uniref:TIGR00297 family protein n=1 Tax=unclassified Roseofilum TaxID=2620099 RepID=UPI001B2D400E|nr:MULTISPECIES: TIGR00297 family protein [unclassified Roseofilum]MBP0012141.1 TIGR00297 family protein [Roseofilum sp. SID3]MBP0025809.1 TIGR00297 family protein [Roseofilum sp. SID2]MBP0037245.1 TIGR00297 family protein [Roseofilum sp. SID1]MBP0044133.1 TIGR00297 family protein [Roseofilum sp. SBFL]
MTDLTIFTNPWMVAVILNTVLLTIVAFAPKKLLTLAGVIHAWVLGVLVWGTLEWPGYAVVGFYFLVGSGVTRIGLAEKEAQGIAEKRSGARGPENVWGSAFVGAVCALGVLLIQYQGGPDELIPWLGLAYVASFSTKLSDTCASEVGKAYGKRTFLITTLQPVARGTEGAVSLEGTLAGMVGAISLALVGWLVGLISLLGVLYCLVAAFLATNVESVIGATVQEKISWLTNEWVNIINITLGAIFAILLRLSFPGF